MRFLISMNMPNAKGMMTHQMTVEHSSANSVEQLCSMLNNYDFIIFKLFYKRTEITGETWWQDRGQIALNTSCIGKVQEFIDMEREDPFDSQNKEASILRTRNQRYVK